MNEQWEPLGGKDKGFEVSSRGRVRGKLGRLIPPDERSIVRGRPSVLIRGELRPIRTLVGAVFGEDMGRVAELVVLGEPKLLQRKARLEAELERIGEAVVLSRTPTVLREERSIREIQPGEDIAAAAAAGDAWATPQAFAAEEARRLGAIYRSGVEVDPGTSLTRAEVEARLRHLRARFGAMVETESQVLLTPPAVVAAPLFAPL